MEGPALRDLDGHTCPSCQDARVRVVERAGLVLLTCGNGCPGRDIERAAKLHPFVMKLRPEVLTVSTCDPVTGQDPSREAAPALLDPFDRYLLTLAYGRKLLPAAEALTVAALDVAAPAEGLLARQALAALAPVEGLRAWPWSDDKPAREAEPGAVEVFAQAVADLARQTVLEADRAERLRLAGVLRAVLREASKPKLRAVAA